MSHRPGRMTSSQTRSSWLQARISGCKPAHQLLTALTPASRFSQTWPATPGPQATATTVVLTSGCLSFNLQLPCSVTATGDEVSIRSAETGALEERTNARVG